MQCRLKKKFFCKHNFCSLLQSVLNMTANKVIRRTQNYRKTLICDIVSICSKDECNSMIFFFYCTNTYHTANSELPRWQTSVPQGQSLRWSMVRQSRSILLQTVLICVPYLHPGWCVIHCRRRGGVEEERAERQWWNHREYHRIMSSVNGKHLKSAFAPS